MEKYKTQQLRTGSTAPRAAKNPALRSAKLSVPRLKNAIPRERLFGLVEESLERSLVWMVGPPGAGKTTLAGTYLERSSRSVIWYRADSGDADLPTVFYHLREAALRISPTAEALPLLSSEYLLDLPTFARNFFRSLFGLFDGAAVLVVDNYQDADEGTLGVVIKVAVAELPNHINILVLSRGLPPPSLATLQLRNSLSLIDWQQLRLTLEEAQEIAVRAGVMDPNLVRVLHAHCDGWVAGLVLLLEHAKRLSAPEEQIVAHARETLFSYFSDELFAAAPAAMQRQVLCTALLPSFTAAQAASFSAAAEAERVIDWLYERNFFIDCREGAERTYQYHPLFRDFLLERGRSFFSQEQRLALLREAARISEAHQQPETAIALCIEANDWSETSRLICLAAPSLLQQGRYTALERWINKLPEHALAEAPWLRYWLGTAHLPFDPRHGRTVLEQAYAQFEQELDAIGSMLACAGILLGYYLEWSDLRPCDRWLEIFQALLENPTVKHAGIEAQVLPCLAGMCLRHPGHPLLESSIARALALMEQSPDLAQRIALAAFVLMHFMVTGQWSRGTQLIGRLEESSEHLALQPLHRIQLTAFKVMWSAFCPGQFPRAIGEAALRRYVELANTTGIRTMDTIGYGTGVYLALQRNDFGLAARLLEQMKAPHRRCEDGHRAALLADVALARGDIQAALTNGDISLAISVSNDSTMGILATRVLLSQIHGARGDFALALEHAEEIIAFTEGTKVSGVLHAGLLLKAYALLNRGDDQAGLEALRRGLLLGKNSGQSVIWPWALEKIYSHLYSVALTHGIEIEYVRELIKLLDIRPISTDVAAWPWPVSIYTLGRFAILRDDEPITFAGKAQKKPLELLKALIALGGRSINIDHIIRAVWPQERAAARASFDIGLMRLRKLLGNPDALTLIDRKLTLNSEVCWVDAWAFERAAAKLQNTAGMEIDGKALDLYRGPFLKGDGGAPWIESMRERLAAKFQRGVLQLGKFEEQRDRWEVAAGIYQRGLEHDRIQEEFYRRLMTCQCRLGQHAEAIKTFRRCRDMLSIHLNTKPSPETEALHKRTLQPQHAAE